MTKPIRIGYSGLTNRIFALRRYSEREDGSLISQLKDEVTAEAVHAVIEHVRADSACPIVDCECAWLIVPGPDEEPDIDDEPPPDYGPPGTGAVIVEYDQ